MRVILCKTISCKFGTPCALLQHIRYEAIWLSLDDLFCIQRRRKYEAKLRSLTEYKTDWALLLASGCRQLLQLPTLSGRWLTALDLFVIIANFCWVTLISETRLFSSTLLPCLASCLSEFINPRFSLSAYRILVSKSDMWQLWRFIRFYMLFLRGLTQKSGF